MKNNVTCSKINKKNSKNFFIRDGRITIDPFDDALVGPNSVDFRLGDRKVYRDRVLDAAIDNPTEDLPVPPEGIPLDPARVYLFNTLERIGSATYVPIIRGRSSVGRLGVFTNITADLIDLGSINQLTLQMHAVIPARVYPGMRIGQVTFWGRRRPRDGPLPRKVRRRRKPRAFKIMARIRRQMDNR